MALAVADGIGVRVAVGVSVGGTRVRVGLTAGGSVGGTVLGVAVSVALAVGVGVTVGVSVGSGVGLGVGVSEGVHVGQGVGLGMCANVGGACVAGAKIGGAMALLATPTTSAITSSVSAPKMSVTALNNAALALGIRCSTPRTLRYWAACVTSTVGVSAAPGAGEGVNVGGT